MPVTEFCCEYGKNKAPALGTKGTQSHTLGCETPGDAPFEGLDADGALSRRPWSLFGRSVMQ